MSIRTLVALKRRTRATADRATLSISSHLVGCCLLTACLAGCQAPATRVSFDVWPAFQEASLGSFPPNSHAPAVAIRETFAFRVRVQSPEQDIAAPSVRVTPPASDAHTLDAAGVRLFRMLPVAVTTWPGWHIRNLPPYQRREDPLDALVPVDGNPAAMPARLLRRQPLDLWLDVAIPVGTPPGDYQMGIELWSGSRALDRRDLAFTVLPVTLPLNDLPPLIAELDHRALFGHHVRRDERPYVPPVDSWLEDPAREALDTVLGTSLELLREHGLNPVLPWLQPPVLIGARGEPMFDWRQYDAVAALALSDAPEAQPGRGIRWPLPTAGLDVAAATGKRGDASTVFHDSYLQKCVEHFGARGWLSGVYILAHGADGRAIAAPAAWCHALASGGEPRPLVVSSTLSAPAARDNSVATTCAGALLEPAASIEPPPRKDSAASTWLALGSPPFSGTTDFRARPVDARALPWHARRLAADAVYLGCVNRWPDSVAFAAPADCARLDPNVLLYPGTSFGLPTPIPSVRLKWLRRGQEDLALLRLVDQRGHQQVAARLLDAVAPIAGRAAADTRPCDGQRINWPADIAAFEDARRWMLDVLTSPAGAPPRSAVAAGRLLDDARTPRLECIGVRVRSGSGRSLIPVEIEPALLVQTTAGAPVAGRLHCGDPPPNEPDGTCIPRRIEIPAGQRRLITLGFGNHNEDDDRAAEITDQPPLAPRGHRSMPIRLALDDGRSVTADARIACVLAAPAPASPRIDGDLSDWPPGDTNTAGDFVLISADGPPDDPRSRPSNPTLAFFLVDRDGLYVGLNCSSSSAPFATPSRRSAIDYEDQIPVGDDLVELLIDPLNAGSRDSADLFHLAIKRTGAHVASIGVPLNDSCSTSRPWPARIDVAVRDGVGRWTVEVRIPWDAFGGAPPRSTVWGMNVTRFDRARQEFSTWSGARRNAYDPLSLGNLMLP